MATQQSLSHESEFAQLINDYAVALAGLESSSQAESWVSVQQVLKVLRCRDRIQAAIAAQVELEDECLAKLVDLDLELQQKSNLICAAVNLEQLRQSLKPSEIAWWWFLQPTVTSSSVIPLADKFDWLWNIGTVASLVIATSFISQTAKAFSAGGFDVLGAFTTISQGAGLAFIAGGTLTDKGKKAVSQALTSIRVPDSLHAEVTFGASLVLLGAAYGLNENLYLVSNFYFDQGQQFEQKGQFSQASQSYSRSLNFSPEERKTKIAIGFLQENLGNFDEAIKIYQTGSAYGNSEFLNAQARAILMRELGKNDWQGGIDEKIISQVEDLLERAERKNKQWDRRAFNNTFNINYGLSQDIIINRAIAKIARIKDTELNEKSKAILREATEIFLKLKPMDALGSIKQSEALTQESEVTRASTIGKQRVDCFYQVASWIRHIANFPDAHGMDYDVQSKEHTYACSIFRYDTKQSSSSDAFLLQKNKFLSVNWFAATNDLNLKSYLIDYARNITLNETQTQYIKRVSLIEDPQIWLSLSHKISRFIEKNFLEVSQEDKNKNIIWRLFLNKNGDIISHIAYDQLSLKVANEQPFLQEDLQTKVGKALIAELQAGGKLEFSDFKIVLSPKGKVLHALPWAVSYTNLVTSNPNLSINDRVRSAFERYKYKSNLSDPAELEALRSVVFRNLDAWGIDAKKGIYYTEPAIFKLKVSSDGQVIKHQASNQVAKDKGWPFIQAKLPELPERETLPYADFKLEGRGLFYTVLPWDSKD